jgi:hypothetical protein
VSRIRWRLSELELHQYRSVVRDLNASGAGLDVGCLRNGDQFELDCFDCYARTVQYGAVYVLSLSLLGLAPKTVLAQFDLASPELDQGTYLLEDPHLVSSSEEMYRLPDKTVFHRREVLNHRIGKDGVLLRGDQLEGVLLVQALEPVPQRYKPGCRMPMVLSITDQLGETSEWSLGLMVQELCFKVVSRPDRKSVFEDEPVAPGSVAQTPHPDGQTGPAPAQESGGPGTEPEVGRAATDDQAHEGHELGFEPQLDA